jgi:hypothetical protein
MHPTSASYLSDLFVRISSEHVYCTVQCCTRLTKTPWIKEEIKKKVHAVRIFWLVLCRLFVCPLSTSHFPHPPFSPSGSTYGTANVLEPTTVKPVYCNTYQKEKKKEKSTKAHRRHARAPGVGFLCRLGSSTLLRQNKADRATGVHSACTASLRQPP